MTSVAAKFMDVDPHKINSFSSSSSPAVKFDISHKNGHPSALRLGHQRKVKVKAEDEEVTTPRTPPREWELDVRALVSSRKWLHNYGLKKNRLELHQLLPAVGFKLCDEFDKSLKKPISSRYGGGLFRQLQRPDGKTFNINCTKDKLYQLEKRLLQAMYLFKRRLEWLTTESRRVFGVIEERSVTIILDIRSMSPQQFDQYRTALQRVLRDQVSQLAKFNLIRACEDLQMYNTECVPVSHDTLENAVQWLWNLDRLAPVSNTATAEAILRASQDVHNEAVYVFTEGTSIESGKEILKEKISYLKLKYPIHVVSFNCDCSQTIKFLKDFAKSTKGKFHAYAVVMELDAYEATPGDTASRGANIMLKRKTFGGIPPGAGVREDVVLIFEEVEEARNNLAQVRMLIERAPEPNRTKEMFPDYDSESDSNKLAHAKDEQYMTSGEWLGIYGLEARRLGIYDVLSGVAFKHLDGVIDVMEKPDNDQQTDAVVHQRLINARYCERFPVVRWKDGKIVHVQVTPEVHRGYEEKVQVAMNKIQQRIDWLNKGSRALFGTVVEDQIYILIDTSASMQPTLGFVKQKIFVLMQEQLRHKRKFNLVTFNSKAAGWKDRLVEVSERSLQSAWSWVQNLSTWGSTNTYGAIQLAMSDPQTQAIYLLTDGRPDQPPKSIIAQVQMHKKIPVHTISFNCQDAAANDFLYSLAEATGGRYHYYSHDGQAADQPEAWESMDIKLLKDEIKRGLENLDKLAGLRDECTSLAWKRETEELRRSMNSETDAQETRHRNPFRPSSAPSRPSSAPPQSPKSDASPRFRPSPPTASQNLPSQSSRVKLQRPRSAKASISRKPLVAGHTRTSLMRTLNSSGRFSPNEWLLPETKNLFELQAERQKDIAKNPQVCEGEQQDKVRDKRKKKLVKASEMSSKQWLSKEGLVAKRLTIIDVIGTTFVPHKAKYVSILDKHVVSKVFDGILPIAHVSKSQQVNLVNPNGVNLKEYERKLNAALDKYNKRLNNLVWNALPSSSKEEFDSVSPAPFMENKQKYLRLLEDAEWPVKESDVLLLIKEIGRGEKFLGQSQSLRKAAAGQDSDEDSADNDDDNDADSNVDRQIISARSEISDSSSQKYKNVVGTKMEEEEDGEKDDASVASEKSDRSRRSDKSDRSQRSERSHRSQKSAASSRKSGASPPRSPRSQSLEKSSPPPSEKDGAKDVEREEVGQVHKEVEKKARGRVKESAETIKSKIRVKLDTLRGHRVIARLDQDGLYYPAVVVKCPDPRHALVSYDSGSNAQVLTRNIILTGGAVARPQLQVGDYVMMRVVNLDSNDECYVPAIIQAEPQKSQAQAKFYSVIMYNGQKASTLRTFLVKISKERFELASMYIAHQHQHSDDTQQNEDQVHVTPRHKRNKKSKKETKTPNKPPKRPPSSRQPRREVESVSEPSSSRQLSTREQRFEEESIASESPRPVSIRDQRIEEESVASDSPRPVSSREQSIIEEELEHNDNGRQSSRSAERGSSRSAEKESSRSAASIDGRTRELDRLLKEIKEREDKQERQMQKLKRKAKKLAKREQKLEARRYFSNEALDCDIKVLHTPSPDLSPDEGEMHSKGEENQSPSLLQLRKSLPRLRPGEEVLARWSDDGWYYRGIVKHDHGDYSYNLEDSTGLAERIWREDIISEDDSFNQVVEADSKVVALHPDYSFSYAPATVLEISETSVEVNFYDGQVSTLPRNETYLSSQAKHDMDVAYILKQERRLIGAAVVARDDRTGAFYPGSVIRRAENGVDYVVGWTDGTEVTQRSIFIFSAFTRRPPLSAGDRVLALADPVQVKFLPGFLIGSSEENLIVKFCDGEVSEAVDPASCYWLGRTYYDDAVDFYKLHDSSFY